MDIFKDISEYKFLNPHILKLKRILQNTRIIDFLLHTPVDYKTVDVFDELQDIQENKEVVLQVIISEEFDIQKAKYLTRLKTNAPIKIPAFSLHGDPIDLVFFQIKSYYLDKFKPSSIYKIRGKIKTGKNKLTISHPIIIQDEKIDSLSDSKKEFLPVYRLTEGLKLNTLQKLINKVFEKITLPEIILDLKNFDKKFNILNFNEALKLIHNSKTTEDYSKALRSLAFYEMLSFQVKLQKAKKYLNKTNGVPVSCNKQYNEIIDLPFELTSDQVNATKEIFEAQKSPSKMMRLLQGDVGSGKTIVAILASLNCVYSGKKAVLIAPTTLLASQHLNTLKTFINSPSLKVHLLTSKTPAKQKREILNDLALGNFDIAIGTHALMEDDIKIKDVGLFVIDEQHNFGVEQRNKLVEKSKNSDVLMMTATPIPRTMSMCIYGDIQTSIIKEKPKNRIPIKTVTFSDKKYTELIQSIQRKILSGSLAYWICPLVEESDKSELIDVINRAENLRSSLPNVNIEILHGRMKEKEKLDIITKFKQQEIQILVATSVVEVGIDVKDADIIVIEHAERFGLSQMHQMRGRVGRGTKESFCVLMYYGNLSEIAKKRLQILKQNVDGFLIAEEDLKLRGSGDLLGTRQSGDSIFKFFDFANHNNMTMDILLLASKITEDDNVKECQMILDFFNEKSEELML